MKNLLAAQFSAFRVSGVMHNLKTEEKVLASTGEHRQRLVIADATGDLKAGDMILAVGTHDVANNFDLERAFWGKKAGEVVQLKVMRADRETTASPRRCRLENAPAVASNTTPAADADAGSADDSTGVVRLVCRDDLLGSSSAEKS